MWCVCVCVSKLEKAWDILTLEVPLIHFLELRGPRAVQAHAGQMLQIFEMPTRPPILDVKLTAGFTSLLG